MRLPTSGGGPSNLAVGADAYTMGSKTTGSVLIDRMKVAGT